MLSSITEGKGKYTEPDEAAEKRASMSVESPQQPGPPRAGASAEHSLQQQVKQRARTSVECPKRHRQISDSDPSSCTRPYGSSDEETYSEEFIIIIELTHSKTILEITVEIEPQPAALDFKNLSQYSSRSK